MNYLALTPSEEELFLEILGTELDTEQNERYLYLSGGETYPEEERFTTLKSIFKKVYGADYD